MSRLRNFFPELARAHRRARTLGDFHEAKIDG